jgi:hypothetical protein
MERRVNELLRKFDFPDIDTKTPPGTPQEVPTGAYIHFAMYDGQTIGVGGDPILWDTDSLTIPPYEFTTVAPATEMVVPKVGYYDVRVELAWDSYADGGSVWLVRTRLGAPTTVYPPAGPTVFTSDAGATFVDVAKAIPFNEGDILEVYVDHNDGSAQDLAYALLEFELVDTQPDDATVQCLSIFTEDGTWDWAAAGSPATIANVWIIGGGGAGGGGIAGDWDAGGGGGGGVLHLTNYAVSGNCAVVVGAGGSVVEDDGNDSSFDGQVGAGGGSGGHDTTSANGADGGCGGGGAGGAITNGTGGNGTQGQDGGNGSGSGNAGGGGGGNSTPGTNGAGGSGGDGGDGIDLSAVVGTGVGDNGWFAGGGGGNPGGSGGLGGGAAAGVAAAADNTGGGGGAGDGGGAPDFGAGGSGIVIVQVC